MLKAPREFLFSNDLAKLTVAFALGIAGYDLVRALVYDLIGPLIAVFVGDLNFETNSFSIRSSDFLYGVVIESALVLALVGVLAHLLFSRQQEGGPGPQKTGPDREP